MTYPIESHLLGPLAMLWLAACLLVMGWIYGRKVLGVWTSGHSGRLHQVGPYILGEKIGQGAMGEVYRARHVRRHRPCAIKLLPRAASERERSRFEKEVQATAQLCHPNTVSIYDYGQTPDGTYYYVMELLDGITLQELVERHGAQPPGRVIEILRQVCAALSEAHGVGLIHRDIKPDNVLLCQNGSGLDTAKLLDFGLVKQTQSAPELSQSLHSVVGTPLYMSPEAIRAPETVSARSDLYGLGAVAYFLLTGAPVFDGNNIIEVCSHHLHSLPESVSVAAGHAIPEELERLVLDCLAKDPERRPASAAELATRLVRCADVETWSGADVEAHSEQPESCSLRSYANLIQGRFDRLESALEERRACA